MYWETSNNWFSSLLRAGERELPRHASSTSSKIHWYPLPCESEQREAFGEQCVMQLVTELPDLRLLENLDIYPDLNLTPWVSLSAWHGLKSLPKGRDKPFLGVARAGACPGFSNFVLGECMS